MKIESIAQVCHEANAAYCRANGDLTQPTWADAPAWQKNSAINGVRFHIAELDCNRQPQPSASHENWLKEKKEAGWVYGEVKCPLNKTHPCCVPYDELPAEQKIKDFLFIGVITGFWKAKCIEK